jgi:hypothetical protein
MPGSRRCTVACKCGWVGPQSVRITGDDGKTFVASGYKRTKEARGAFRASLMPEGDSADNAPIGPIPPGQTVENTGDAINDQNINDLLAQSEDVSLEGPVVRAANMGPTAEDIGDAINDQNINDLLAQSEDVRPECPLAPSAKTGGGDSSPRN